VDKSIATAILWFLGTSEKKNSLTITLVMMMIVVLYDVEGWWGAGNVLNEQIFVVLKVIK